MPFYRVMLTGPSHTSFGPLGSGIGKLTIYRPHPIGKGERYGTKEGAIRAFFRWRPERTETLEEINSWSDERVKEEWEEIVKRIPELGIEESGSK